MSLLDGEALVIYVDKQVKDILSNDRNPVEILMVLNPFMKEIKHLVNAASREELDDYCEKYEGFSLFLAFMEELMNEVSNGDLPLPVYH